MAVGELAGEPIAVSSSEDGTLRVWQLASGTQRGEPLTGHKGKIWAVAVGELAGEAIAVSAGSDGTLAVWELASGRQRGEPLIGHTGTVWAVAIGEVDGEPVAISAGSDGALRFGSLPRAASAASRSPYTRATCSTSRLASSTVKRSQSAPALMARCACGSFALAVSAASRSPDTPDW